MIFKLAPIPFGPYKEWREIFNNEKIYTRADMVRALHDQNTEMEKAARVIGVMQMLPNDYKMMMQIIRVERSPEGIFIVVK